MSEETKDLIKKIFIIIWGLLVCLLVYRLAVRPMTINLDLSFIFKLLPDLIDQAAVHNFIKWL